MTIPVYGADLLSRYNATDRGGTISFTPAAGVNRIALMWGLAGASIIAGGHTYDGHDMTQLGTTGNWGGYHGYLYYYLIPDTDTGAKNVYFQVDNGSNNMFCVCSYAKVKSIRAVTSLACGFATNPTIAPTVLVGDLTLWLSAWGGTISDMTQSGVGVEVAHASGSTILTELLQAFTAVTTTPSNVLTHGSYSNYFGWGFGLESYPAGYPRVMSVLRA